MNDIPKDVDWFIAQIVVLISVSDEGSVGHINYVLIKANSLDEAYRKARRVGELEESTHLNKRGNKVDVEFLGLKSLTPVYEDLEDGSEILYDEIPGTGRSEMRSLVRKRSELVGTGPGRTRSAPDYGYPEIEREAKLLVRKLRAKARQSPRK